ncbi:MAG: sugar transferase [Clostridiales bacterium]|nr:sugar transferase [Clostridiales bacterium]
MESNTQTYQPQQMGYRIGRRAQDIIFSMLALIILCVPMLVISLVIWLDSPGDSPVFKQDRVGKNGKIFRIYKFRSMYPNAETNLEELLKLNEMDGPVFKIKNDPRITRIGRPLRKSGLDELPQLVNILKGDMSIVGPRPALPRETMLYNDYERQRLSVKPGLTCYWQIQPHRNNLSFSKWVELDLKYIRERSFFTDWKIILKTIRVVFSGQGQ